ncbi:MAG: hypothetical protein HUK22_05010, partial [Thermoguttaceae bacterium]|nr:hypothetical protein [Thermoguttaceae bacterium]
MSAISLHSVRRKLNRVFLFDREGLRRRLTAIERRFDEAAKKAGAKTDAAKKIELDADWEKDLRALDEDCDASIEKVERRRKAFPKITYDAELPVSERREEIKKLIAENQVVVVCGETGSGKSTQLPKICLELGLG